MFCLNLLGVPSVPIKWALRYQMSGIDRTSNGHLLPVWWAQSAQITGRFLGTPCESVASLSCMILYGDFVMLRWRFLWYFSQFYDTSMILFCKTIRKYHSSILLSIRRLCQYFTKKMILWDFFHEKNFFRVRVSSSVNLKNIWYNTLTDTPKITSRRRLYYMAT